MKMHTFSDETISLLFTMLFNSYRNDDQKDSETPYDSE